MSTKNKLMVCLNSERCNPKIRCRHRGGHPEREDCIDICKGDRCTNLFKYEVRRITREHPDK